ncbi:MAG: hypothetical protein V2I97_17115, partial [Desulfococcaceae bacterium]|nr:hypothetical protein [Desulfococcaceae bacterium]
PPPAPPSGEGRPSSADLTHYRFRTGAKYKSFLNETVRAAALRERFLPVARAFGADYGDKLRNSRHDYL